MDGGVVDNLPIRPLIEGEGCDFIFAIRLGDSPFDLWSTDLEQLGYQQIDIDTKSPDQYVEDMKLRSHWIEIERRIIAAQLTEKDVVSFSPEGGEVIIHPGIRVDLPREWPNVIVAQPRQDLGDIVTGMLNFNLELPSWLRAVGGSLLPKKVQDWIGRTLVEWNIDGRYTSRLIELGRADACRQPAFFWDALKRRDSSLYEWTHTI